MNEDQAASARQRRVQLRSPLLVPAGIVRVEDDDLGGLKLFRRRPLPGGGDVDVGRGGQQFRPPLLPERIIVFARPVILRTGAEHDVERFARRLVRAGGLQQRFDFGARAGRRSAGDFQRRRLERRRVGGLGGRLEQRGVLVPEILLDGRSFRVRQRAAVKQKFGDVPVKVTLREGRFAGIGVMAGAQREIVQPPVSPDNSRRPGAYASRRSASFVGG